MNLVAQIKFDIPEALIKKYAEERIKTLEGRVKFLERELAKYRARLTTLDANKIKKENKELERRVFLARDSFRQAIQNLIQEAGFHITEYELEENRR